MFTQEFKNTQSCSKKRKGTMTMSKIGISESSMIVFETLLNANREAMTSFLLMWAHPVSLVMS